MARQSIYKFRRVNANKYFVLKVLNESFHEIMDVN